MFKPASIFIIINKVYYMSNISFSVLYIATHTVSNGLDFLRTKKWGPKLEGGGGA